MSLLDFVIDSIAAVALVYFTAGLALSLREKFIMPRPRICPGQLAIDFTAAAEVETTAPAAPPLTPDFWELPVEPIAASPTPLFPPLPFLLMLPAARSPRFADAVVFFTRRQNSTPDWAKMSPEQLRRECQQRGIKWRNSRADGKHLRKAEMVCALAG